MPRSTIVAVFAVLGFCYHQAAHFSSLPPLFRRHPQVCLHLLFWGVILLLWKTSVDDGAWRVALVGFATILPTILWRLGYLLQSGQRARVAGTRFTDHLLYLLPWGPDLTVAYGKGLDYLARHEARDEDALARCQLAGVKLILLAILWKVVLSLLQGLVHGSQNWANRGLGGFAMTPLPAFGPLLALGSNAPLWHSWFSIYYELVRQALELAIAGHFFVGVFRLFGFNIFRSTYKPLLAETVLQFWGR